MRLTVADTVGMWRRAQAIGDRDVARQMRKIFKDFPAGCRQDPAAAAEAYARLMFTTSKLGRPGVRVEKQFKRKCFDVGLLGSTSEFDRLTKHAILISESCLLFHGTEAPYHHLGKRVDSIVYTNHDTLQPEGSDDYTVHYGIHCPNPSVLGTWIIEAEPLIKEGLSWYLPSYSIRRESSSRYGWHSDASTQDEHEPMSQVSPADYLMRGGQLIDPSASSPSESPLVRPVLQIDLPVVEGVSLRNFSRITVDEFDAHKRFHEFLSTHFLSMSEALNAERSQIELARLRQEIEEQVSAVRAEFVAAARRRPLGAVGAKVASTSARLVAVDGSLMRRVLATPGPITAEAFWATVDEIVENHPRATPNGEWRYVWVLSRKSRPL
ncbi:MULTISPECIES: hypothetical protein [unclassified Streptomyces]|uniref:hypothetical protein n=1 Tax=unclassified Streptomyces TaxID=2593676 RepID=UPI000938A5F5|nr:hypothetical protein [Streptomyces sp. CB02058]OKI95660.1 hypothetical protein AMK10_08120 [Streptomyces sp. CB02058]